MIQHPSKNNSQINAPILIDFRTNLAPFWEGFGGQDGVKLAPNRSQNRSSNQSKKWSPFGWLLGPIFIDFGPQDGPQEGVKTFIFESFWVSWGHLGAKRAPRPPKTLQRPPRPSPRGPQDHSKRPPETDSGPQVDGFWTPSWSICGSFLVQIW